MLCAVIGEPIKLTGKRALRKALAATHQQAAAPAGASVRYSDRRAVQAIGRIDRGADQNEGLNGTLA